MTPPENDQYFFISYAASDRSWAEWIAASLEQRGYSTLLQAWDFQPGADFVRRMHDATRSAKQTIAVLSNAYFDSKFGEAEWRAAFVKDPGGDLGLLIPVRVEDCQPSGLLASRVYLDLVGLDETSARARLLQAVERNPDRPAFARFPGAPATYAHSPNELFRFPGSAPPISNLPARHRFFSGRQKILGRMLGDLTPESSFSPKIGVIYGLGGTGKTELALEFAHRFSANYDLIWWLDAQQPTSVVTQLAQLSRRLGVPRSRHRQQMATAALEALRNRTRWLLIYDNAEEPRLLDSLMPAGGDGTVLITSQWSAWAARALPWRLGVWQRTESKSFLRLRCNAQDADESSLDALADLLGDLPLALTEAAAYLEQTQESLDGYLQLVRERVREVFDLHLDEPTTSAGGDIKRVATVWSVSLDRVHKLAPAAEDLLNLLAFLAPEVPRELPGEFPQALPPRLATTVLDRLAYNRLLAMVGRYSLATLQPTEIGLHRLVQAVIRARLGQSGEREWATTATRLIRAGFPSESDMIETWPQCQRLLPHLLSAADHAQRLGVCSEAVGWLMDRASTYLREQGQYRRAKPLAEQAFDMTTAAFGPDHLDVGWRRDTLGQVLLALGDYAGARNQFEEALRLGEAIHGPVHSDIAIWRNNLGGVLYSLNDLDEAREQFEKALHISEATLGPSHPDIGIRRSNLGVTLLKIGDLDGARIQLEKALRISEAALGSNHPQLGVGRNNLGRALLELGDLSGARDQLERALSIGEAALGPDHPDLSLRCSNLSQVLRKLGDLVGARDQLKKAVLIGEAALGPNHPQVRRLRRDLLTLTQETGVPPTDTSQRA
ncbi:FxSxx-COOH system tetratricopeptide repeat protein [Solwaraspora sp. WMMB335]|uniref:FxSxx-COOH system tetratricopeptide repeat protein n=1 Tax=Solwaraspora sp. WMMB335 TaxID=3404118 RepID=UPI003B9301EF